MHDPGLQGGPNGHGSGGRCVFWLAARLVAARPHQLRPDRLELTGGAGRCGAGAIACDGHPPGAHRPAANRVCVWPGPCRRRCHRAGRLDRARVLRQCRWGSLGSTGRLGPLRAAGPILLPARCLQLGGVQTQPAGLLGVRLVVG